MFLQLECWSHQRVGTGCPNKFGVGSEMFVSEASIVYKKICISLQRYAFSAFFENCKKWKWILKQLFSDFKQFTE